MKSSVWNDPGKLREKLRAGGIESGAIYVHGNAIRVIFARRKRTISRNTCSARMHAHTRYLLLLRTPGSLLSYPSAVLFRSRARTYASTYTRTHPYVQQPYVLFLSILSHSSAPFSPKLHIHTRVSLSLSLSSSIPPSVLCVR